MSNSTFSKQQLLDLKHYGQELANNVNVAYYSANAHDQEWHSKEALEYLRKLLELSKGVEL